MVRENRIRMANRTAAEKVDAVRIRAGVRIRRVLRQNVGVEATAGAKAASAALATIGCGHFCAVFAQQLIHATHSHAGQPSNARATAAFRLAPPDTRLCLKTLDSDVATVARPWASSVLSQVTHALASVATSFKGFQTKPNQRSPSLF